MDETDVDDSYDTRRRTLHSWIKSSGRTIKAFAEHTDRSYNYVVNVLTGLPGNRSRALLDDLEDFLQ